MSEIPEAAEARDPETSADRLGQLADLYPELCTLIVMNPSCPPELRQWIIEERGSSSKHPCEQVPAPTRRVGGWRWGASSSQ